MQVDDRSAIPMPSNTRSARPPEKKEHQEFNEALWQSYLSIPALRKYVGRLTKTDLNTRDKILKVYQAVIINVEKTFANFAAILSASEKKYDNNSVHPSRLEELENRVLERQNLGLIEFYRTVVQKLLSAEIRTPDDLVKANYEDNAQFAEAIKAWFDSAESKSCLSQIRELSTGYIPPQIRSLENLEELVLTNRFIKNDYLTIPIELAECKKLQRFSCNNVRIREVPTEVLELPYTSHSFEILVNNQHYFLRQMVYGMGGADYLKEKIKTRRVFTPESDPYRIGQDTNRLMRQWIEENKESLNRVTKIDLSAKFSRSFFPEEIMLCSNLRSLAVETAYFFPEITALRSLRKLTFFNHNDPSHCKEFVKHGLPDLSTLEHLEELTIPLLTIDEAFLELKNLKRLTITPLGWNATPSRENLPCDEILDSSIQGIQDCLRDNNASAAALGMFLDIYRSIIKHIGKEPELRAIEANFENQPGKLYLQLKQWLTRNNELLIPLAESCPSDCEYQDECKKEIDTFLNGNHDDYSYYSYYSGSDEGSSKPPSPNKNDRLAAMTERTVVAAPLRAVPRAVPRLVAPRGDSRALNLSQFPIPPPKLTMPYRWKIVLRDWVQTKSMSKSKIVAGAVFGIFLTGISLYLAKSITAKVLTSTFIAVVAFNLLFKVAKESLFRIAPTDGFLTHPN